MKKLIPVIASMALLAGPAYSNVNEGSSDPTGHLFVYDSTASDFLAVFKPQLGPTGDLHFATEGNELTIDCIQGKRLSCGFDGPIQQSTILIYDEAAAEFHDQLNIPRDPNGRSEFISHDGLLSIMCDQGLRYACSITVK